LNKSSGRADWFTILVENIQGATIRGEKYWNNRAGDYFPRPKH
jgi:hypothetical protein